MRLDKSNLFHSSPSVCLTDLMDFQSLSIANCCSSLLLEHKVIATNCYFPHLCGRSFVLSSTTCFKENSKMLSKQQCDIER